MNPIRPDFPDDHRFPDPPPPGGSGARPDDAPHQSAIRAARARYEKGLLAWLRQADGATAGLDDMHTALARIEAEEASPSSRCFWRIARGCIDALSAPAVSRQPGARQLCAHLDIQMRRHQEGDRRVDEGLLRETLAFISRIPAGASPAVDRIRTAGDLDAFPISADLPGEIPELTEACGESGDPGGAAGIPPMPSTPAEDFPATLPDFRATLRELGKKAAHLRSLAQAVGNLPPLPESPEGGAAPQELSRSLAATIDELENLRQALWRRADASGASLPGSGTSVAKMQQPDR